VAVDASDGGVSSRSCSKYLHDRLRPDDQRNHPASYGRISSDSSDQCQVCKCALSGEGVESSFQTGGSKRRIDGTSGKNGCRCTKKEHNHLHTDQISWQKKERQLPYIIITIIIIVIIPIIIVIIIVIIIMLRIIMIVVIVIYI